MPRAGTDKAVVGREALVARRFQTELMLTFSRVHQQILRRTAERLVAAGFEDITPARANALIVLFNARRPINARELARGLGISEVTVSRFLVKMEADGWVARTPDPHDRRAMLIAPTAYARDVFPRLVDVCNAVLDDLFGGFSQGGLNALADELGRVQANLEPGSIDK